MGPPPPRDRSHKVRPPQNVGRCSLPLEKEVKTGWTSHWGDGRYFEKREKKIDPNLHGTPFPVIILTDKGKIYDVAGPRGMSKRSSTPSRPEPPPNPRGWQQHVGEGRYFQWPQERVDACLRGEEGTTVRFPYDKKHAIRHSFRPNARSVSRSGTPRQATTSPTTNEMRNANWRRHMGEIGNFESRYREHGYKDCDLEEAKPHMHTDY